jgi:protein ImuB
VVRLACVSVPDLSLQILLRDHRDALDSPIAVVDRDSPQGTILWVNASAKRNCIRPGMRYAEGLSVAPTLRAGVVGPGTLEAALGRLTECMAGFSPQVEPASDFPGIFWLNVAGLTPLYPSLEVWARSLRGRISDLGFHANVVVGFSRFGTYAVAREQAGLSSSRRESVRETIRVFEDSFQEAEAAKRVPLDCLDLGTGLREFLAKLGVTTVGTFLRLPPAGLHQRLGSEAHRLHRLASGEQRVPLQPVMAEDPVEAKTILDEGIVDVLHLLTRIRHLLGPMLEALASKKRAITTLHVLLALDTREHRIETIQPAAPTLDATVLLELVQLRLHGSRLPAGVVEIELRVQTTEASQVQIQMFTAGDSSRHKPEAGARALARLRAELGDDAIVHAKLHEGHLPEASFRLEPWNGGTGLARPHPRRVALRSLIRRMYSRPIPLPSRPSSERNENWLLHDLECGPVIGLLGPYVVSGGWWLRSVHRDYHYIETQRGDLLWSYYDRARRRWFLQGRVE